MSVLAVVYLVASMALWLGLTASAAGAQEADALRREIEEMRKQLESVQQQYQRAIDTLSDRLRRLEAQPPPVTVPPGPVQPAPVQPGLGLGQSQMAPPSATDILRPRQPFGLYQQRGPGQLLFDMGIAADFVGNITQDNVDKANAGTFAGSENRFFPREIELSLFGQIDPYARGEIRIEAAEEEPGAETEVSLAEGHLTLLTLPYGLQLKMGQMRNRFGLTNERHEHDLLFIDRPDALRVFLDDEGLLEKGAELTWVPNLPVYLEGLFGIFNGDNETAFGYGKVKQPLLTARARTFFELSDASALQLGVSGARGQTPDRLYSTVLGVDAKYKYRPDGWLHPLLTLDGEALFSLRKVNVDNEVDTDDDGEADTFFTNRRTRERWGWYLHTEVQPFRRWAGGVRYDWTQYPVNPGSQWAIEPYLMFRPSEFLRFRLAYKHTERSHRDGFTDNGGSARIMDEFLFQATFLLGAHPAHPF